MNNGVTSSPPEDDLEARQVWFVPRRVMCAIFWLSNVLLFTGIILLVTSKHKGLTYRSWGGVLLGLGFCLLLACFILCVHAYCIITVDAPEEPPPKSTPPPPLSIDARPNNGFDRSKDAAGFKPSRPELVPLETCFDRHMEASLHAPPPPSYSQCSLNNALAKRREVRGNGYVIQRAISERPSSPIWKEASVETHLSAPNTPSFERGRAMVAGLARTQSNAKARRENFSKSRTCDWVNDTNQAPAPGGCSSLPTMCPAARTHAQTAPPTAIDGANPTSSSGRRSRDTGEAPARFYVPAFDSSGSLTPDDASASRSKRGDYGPQRADSDVGTPSHIPSAKKSSRPGVFLPGVGGTAETRQGGTTSAAQDAGVPGGKLGTSSGYDHQPPPGQYDNMQHMWVHPNKVKHFEV